MGSRRCPSGLEARVGSVLAGVVLGLFGGFGGTGEASAQPLPPPGPSAPSQAAPAPSPSAPASPTPPPPLEAGGLAPPGSPPPLAPAVLETERDLSKAEQEDSGRGLQYFFVSGALGVGHAGLMAASGDALVDSRSLDPVGTGWLYGGDLGVRLLAFSVGARFRMLATSDYQLFTLAGRFALHVPIGSLEPYVHVGAGYAGLAGTEARSIDGVDVFLGGGLDVYLSNVVSVGMALDADLLLLYRAAAPADGVALYAESGSAIGLGGSLSAILGLHF